MVLDWKRGKLAEGLGLYRVGRYFEAHEAWEEVWLQSHGSDKTFVQIMIQLAAANLHYERANRAGTTSLLTAILQHLDEKHAEMQEDLNAWLRALTSAHAVSDEPSPKIRHLDALDR